MAQLDLLLADGDRVRLLHWTLQQGAVLVPRVHHLEPHYEEIRTVAQLAPYLAERMFFVLNPDYQTEKLRMRAYVSQYRGAGFYIAQRYGGPSIHYLLYPQREEEGRLLLGIGSIDHYPFYYSNVDNRRLDASPALKAFYARATRFMKQGALRIQGEQRTYWVAQEGAALLAGRRAFVPEPWMESALGSRGAG